MDEWTRRHPLATLFQVEVDGDERERWVEGKSERSCRSFNVETHAYELGVGNYITFT